jgi:glycosidase
MQWNSSKYAGFSTHQPWLAVNPNYEFINAEDDIKNSEGVYRFLQSWITYRKNHSAFIDGDLTIQEEDDEHVFAYTRSNKNEHILILLNTSQESIPLSSDRFEGYHFEFGNGKSLDLTGKIMLPPYFAGVYRKGIYGNH